MNHKRRNNSPLAALTPDFGATIAPAGSQTPHGAFKCDFSRASVSPPTYEELKAENEHLKRVIEQQGQRIIDQSHALKHLNNSISFAIHALKDPLEPLKPKQTLVPFGKLRKVRK